MSSISLTYFDSPGRAEPVRLALRLGGLPFTDKRLNFQQFGELRSSGALPLGSVPLLEIDGVTYVQTAAMLRYVAKIGDASLYPADPLAALAVDSVIDCINDTWYGALMPSLFERDVERKMSMRAQFVAGAMTKVLTYIDGVLARSGGPFVAGEALSLADLTLVGPLLQIRGGRLDGVGPELLDAWPRIGALVDAYLAHPRIVALSQG
jgi:glutathione S-transferase